MKACARLDVQMHLCLTSALVGGEWSAWRCGCFTPPPPGKSLFRISIGPRNGLDDRKKGKCFTLSGIELRPALSRFPRPQGWRLYCGQPWCHYLHSKPLVVSSECWRLLIALLRETKQLMALESCTIPNTERGAAIVITLVTEISNNFPLYWALVLQSITGTEVDVV
jgi:hypothetical protein